MGNGTKVALVALLILMVVVIARFVGDNGEDMDTVAPGRPEAGPTPELENTPPVPRTVAARRPPAERGREVDATRYTVRNTSPGGRSRRVYNVSPTRPVPPATPQRQEPSPGPGAPRPLAPPVSAAVTNPTPHRVAPESSPGTPGTTREEAGRRLGVVGPEVVRPGHVGPGGPIITTLEDTPTSSQKQVRVGGGVTQTPRPKETVGSGKTTPRKGLSTGRQGGSDSSYPKVYTLEKGDTLWDLAETHYGHGKFYRRIVKANPGIKPNAGNKFTIPAPVLPRSGAESSRRLSTPNVGSRAAKRVPTSSRASASADFTWYKVKPNDTLMALAKQFYDDSSKYEVIEKANRTVKYQGLQAGSTIKIPSRKRKQ